MKEPRCVWILSNSDSTPCSVWSTYEGAKKRKQDIEGFFVRPEKDLFITQWVVSDIQEMNDQPPTTPSQEREFKEAYRKLK